MRALCGSVAMMGVMWGCGSDAATRAADTGPAPSVGDGGAATPSTGEGDPSPMRPGWLDRTGSVRSVSQQLDRLRDANQVLSLFVKQDPTLTLTGTACDNANNIAARANGAVSAMNMSCAKATATCATGTAQVTATFTSCAVGDTGNTVSGSATAKVSAATVDAVTTVTVALTLDQVSVTTVDGRHTLHGTITTSTSDLKTYALMANLTVDAYAITFSGTTKATENAEGHLEGVTLDGTGTLSGTSVTEVMGSSTCTTSSLAYTAVALHRSFAQCRADAGTVSLTASYTCTTTTTTRGKPRTTMTTAIVTDRVEWNGDTPTTGQVHVVTSTTLAGQTTQAEKDVELPGDCP